VPSISIAPSLLAKDQYLLLFFDYERREILLPTPLIREIR